MQFPQCRQCSCSIRNGILSCLMQPCGHTATQLPHPIQLSVMKYPSVFFSTPPNVKEALSIGFLERSNHSPLPSHPVLPSAYHPKAHECSFQPNSPDLVLHEIGTGRRLPQVRSLHIRQRRLSLINLLSVRFRRFTWLH